MVLGKRKKLVHIPLIVILDIESKDKAYHELMQTLDSMRPILIDYAINYDQVVAVDYGHKPNLSGIKNVFRKVV